MAINFDALPQENPFALVPVGVYKALIVEASMKTGKDATKPPYLNLRYKLTDANGKDCGTLYDIISESDSSVVQYKIGRFIKACKIPCVGSMELSDLAKIVVNKTIVVDVGHDTKSNPVKAQVDLFTREAYYPEEQFEEINALVNPPAEGADFEPDAPATPTGPVDNAFQQTTAEQIPFDAQDGGAPATPAAAPTTGGSEY